MAIGASNASASKDGLTRRQRCEQVRSSLETERSTFMTHWQELADYIRPRRMRITTSDVNQGTKRNSNIIDSTATIAMRTLQSGMHAGLTSPARPWMKLTVADQDLAERPAVKAWTHEVTRRMLDVFLRSNLYNALPTVYGDIGLFATAAVGILEDDEDLMRAYSYPIGSYVFAVDKRGLPAVFSRKYSMTCRQIVEEFATSPYSSGMNRQVLSQSVLSAWDQSNYDARFDVVWFVGPNAQYDKTRLSAKYRMPYSSCYYELGAQDSDFRGDAFLRESGYNEFPVMVPRWDITGEDTYGTDSPGIITLGDVKQLQLMQRRKAQAVEKAINPPLVGPTGLRNQEVSTIPGRITYEDERDGMKGLRPIHEVRLEGLQYLLQSENETRQRIREGYFADLFLMLAQSENVQPITAEEVRARQEEKLIALGPVLERTNDELLDPLVDRVFAMMLRVGAIPEPPEELKGITLKVEYTSILAQAQKLVGVVGQDRFLSSVVNLAQTFPSVTYKINEREIVDNYADMLGVPPKLIRTDEEADALMAAAAQQQQQAQQAENLAKYGKAAQALGNTPLDGRQTALQAVIDGVGA